MFFSLYSGIYCALRNIWYRVVCWCAITCNRVTYTTHYTQLLYMYLSTYGRPHIQYIWPWFKIYFVYKLKNRTLCANVRIQILHMRALSLADAGNKTQKKTNYFFIVRSPAVVVVYENVINITPTWHSADRQTIWQTIQFQRGKKGRNGPRFFLRNFFKSLTREFSQSKCQKLNFLRIYIKRSVFPPKFIYIQ